MWTAETRELHKEIEIRTHHVYQEVDRLFSEVATPES